jgi:prepilin-type N-terminal cleavage/methylation domain-containing protein
MTHISAQADAGFTVLELLVVLVVISLVSGLAATLVPIRTSSAGMARTQLSLQAWLQEQETVAAQTGAGVTIELAQTPGADTRLVALGKDATWVPPTGTSLTLETRRQEPRVQFFADGSATAARFVLQTGEHQRRIIVEPVTGAIGTE